MALLTLENLDLRNLAYYDYKTGSRGRIYYNEQRVKVDSFDGRSAQCLVRGENAIYAVRFEAESRLKIHARCTCPQVLITPVCKHIVAALLALRDYVIEKADHDWQYRLMQALENSPRSKAPGAARQKYAVVFGLHRDSYRSEPQNYRLLPYRIRAGDWPGVAELEQTHDRQEQNRLLETDRSWSGRAEAVSQPLEARSVVNLPPEGVQLYNLMLKMGGYYYGLGDFAAYLPLMATLDAPIFEVTERNIFKNRYNLLPDPAPIEAALVRDGEAFTLQAGLSLDGQIYTAAKHNLHFLSTSPAWVLAGRTIVQVANPEALSLLAYFPIHIPAKEAPQFRAKYFQAIAERIPIQGDVVSWQDVDCEPLPRLYLHDEAGSLQASLRFGYGDYEEEAGLRPAQVAYHDLPGSWGMARVHRRLEREAYFHQLLTDARYGLRRSGPGAPAGHFGLRARTHPLDFLVRSIPLLTQAGFEVYGEEALKAGRINRATPSLSLHVGSGQDWFEVQAVVHYGEQEVSLKDIRHALLRNERYIKLADGSIGQIPDEWLARYKKLFDLAEEQPGGLRVREYHLPLVETLLEGADEVELAAEFKQRRELLRGFEQVKPRPVPQGFTGELRPYQKAGLDWLHFLDDYGFGGCLADDMGLGKTVEVLAFLQSLREQVPRPAATLLVVPKSLLANWQREAERFAPGLKILEYVGNLRNKDTASFEACDIVLTTYGTLLRDIESLRGYTFDYAILDESQAIKNPLALSSKAVRLLKARRRLVMTGTPVENNTFELWSQFAFLNPGLLGSVDYFRREFAAPIEGHADEDTAKLLRRLIYPFILRRTKGQVAPELPERSERVLYTDLEPAQRKLYNRTRDTYRGLLLGMIDTQGIDDVRMKILEGLLRLRQVCIHPALLEPAYRGESAKFELLLETLDTLRAEGHKALIFSQFVQVLHLLRKELDGRKIPYAYLDGQTQERQAEVDRFQGDPELPFFLISLKAGGVGLNLTAADYVIHLDPWWNPAVEMQAADRAHRIGQDKPVFIYKIIARNTVEEKILQLQEHKKELVDKLIAPEGSFFKSITREDVSVLFS